jgi:hypothetical protein
LVRSSYHAKRASDATHAVGSGAQAARLARARARMRELGVHTLLLSTGADLSYLTGYEPMPLELIS